MMMPQKTHRLPQGPSHLATPFIIGGAHRSRGFSHWSLVIMAQTVGDMDRLARLLGRNGQSALGADLRSRISNSSGSAYGGGRASKGGLAAGTAPNRIGADHNGAPVLDYALRWKRPTPTSSTKSTTQWVFQKKQAPFPAFDVFAACLAVHGVAPRSGGHFCLI